MTYTCRFSELCVRRTATADSEVARGLECHQASLARCEQ